MVTLRRGTVAAASALLVVPLLAAAPAPSTAPIAAHGGHHGASCDLVDGTLAATTTVDAARTQQWAQYGDTSGAWTGADSTYSLPLDDGSLGWFFSDTFLGDVLPDGSRPQSAPFVNNSIVVEQAGALTTVTGGTAADPTAIIPPTADGDWHWIGNPTSARHGDVHVPVLQFGRTGTGSFDFAWQQNLVAVLDGDTLQLDRLVPAPSETGTNWGSWTEPYRHGTLVYGVRDVDGVRSSFVAYVTGDGLLGHWRYWDGRHWSHHEEDAVPIAQHVANEHSVAPFEDGWLLVTHDTTEAFGTRIVAQVSCSPTGPFVEATTLYETPETGALGSYGDPDVFTYNAHEHPELRDGDTLLVTYNVNTFDNVGDVYDDVTIYRPRFLQVALTLEP